MTDPWLQCWLPLVDPDRRLVCFPHAGGSANFFQGWKARFGNTEVIAVRYPGRAERIDEPPATDLRVVASNVAESLTHLSDVPLALFGHSMGAVVALETARALESKGITAQHLFASGSREGFPMSTTASKVDQEDDAVMADLIRLGGTRPELAADPAFRELVLPYILADGRMFANYQMSLHPKVACPITVIAGDADGDSDVRPWRSLATGMVREVVVAGGHFYLLQDPPIALVASTLSST